MEVEGQKEAGGSGGGAVEVAQGAAATEAGRLQKLGTFQEASRGYAEDPSKQTVRRLS